MDGKIDEVGSVYEDKLWSEWGFIVSDVATHLRAQGRYDEFEPLLERLKQRLMDLLRKGLSERRNLVGDDQGKGHDQATTCQVMAWLLATSADSKLRDAALAVELAEM